MLALSPLEVAAFQDNGFSGLIKLMWITVFPKGWPYEILCLCFYREKHPSENSLWLESCQQGRNLSSLALGQNSQATSEGLVAMKMNNPCPSYPHRIWQTNTAPNVLRSVWKTRKEQSQSDWPGVGSPPLLLAGKTLLLSGWWPPHLCWCLSHQLAQQQRARSLTLQLGDSFLSSVSCICFFKPF